MHRCIYLKFGGFPSQEIPGAGGGRKIAGTRLESTATSEQVVARSFVLIEVCTLRPIFVMDLHFSLCLLLSLREGWLGACCRCCVVLLCSVAILAQVFCCCDPQDDVGAIMHRRHQGDIPSTPTCIARFGEGVFFAAASSGCLGCSKTWPIG